MIGRKRKVYICAVNSINIIYRIIVKTFGKNIYNVKKIDIILGIL